MSIRRRTALVMRLIRLSLGAVLVVYFVGRAVVEPFLVNPNQPASYRDDWGGPHYVGVIAVHVVPGLFVAGLAVLWARRLRTRVSSDLPSPLQWRHDA